MWIGVLFSDMMKIKAVINKNKGRFDFTLQYFLAGVKNKLVFSIWGLLVKS